MVFEVKKRSLDDKSEKKQFLEFLDKEIKEVLDRVHNGDKRLKRENDEVVILKVLRVSKIVFLLQSFGMRINEAVSLTKTQLDEVLGGELEYLVSKSDVSKIRKIIFSDYVEYRNEYELLKEFISCFLKLYHSGLYSEIEKKEFYDQKVTKALLKKRTTNFVKTLQKMRLDDSEIPKRVRKFKAEEQNQIGYVYHSAPAYVVKFTTIFNKLLKKFFGNVITDDIRVKTDKKGHKRLRNSSEIAENEKKSKYTSHSLRAGFVVSQYSSGKDLVEIQKDIKHSDLNMTNAYLVNAKRDRKPVAPAGSVEVEKFKKIRTKDGIEIEYSSIEELKELKELGII